MHYAVEHALDLALGTRGFAAGRSMPHLDSQPDRESWPMSVAQHVNIFVSGRDGLDSDIDPHRLWQLERHDMMGSSHDTGDWNDELGRTYLYLSSSDRL